MLTIEAIKTIKRLWCDLFGKRITSTKKTAAIDITCYIQKLVDGGVILERSIHINGSQYNGERIFYGNNTDITFMLWHHGDSPKRTDVHINGVQFTMVTSMVNSCFCKITSVKLMKTMMVVDTGMIPPYIKLK